MISHIFEINFTYFFQVLKFHAQTVFILHNYEKKEGTIHILRHPTSVWDRTFNLIYHKDKYITESIELLNHLFVLC